MQVGRDVNFIGQDFDASGKSAGNLTGQLIGIEEEKLIFHYLNTGPQHSRRGIFEVSVGEEPADGEWKSFTGTILDLTVPGKTTYAGTRATAEQTESIEGSDADKRALIEKLQAKKNS